MNHFMLALLDGGSYQDAQILNESTVKMLFTHLFAPEPSMEGITYGLLEHFHSGKRVLPRDRDGV
jgi:hypothetical protein